MSDPSQSNDNRPPWSISRRGMVRSAATLTSAHVLGQALAQPPVASVSQPRLAAPIAIHEPEPSLKSIVLRVNGRSHSLTVDTRTTVLDALRESLAMKGTKKGCDHGQCGACTILIDGRRTNACLTLAVMHDDHEITTIEGLSQGEQLHPMQAAFLKHDGFQCGYCTPGQICSSVGMLTEVRMGMPSHVTRDLATATASLTDEEIRERMSGNLCRCSAYPNIVTAIRDVAGAPS